LKPPSALPVRFDPQRRAASKELKTALLALIEFLEGREAVLGLRQRARKEGDRRHFHLAIEAIACNLAWLSMTGPDQTLAVPRSSGAMWSKSRYRSPVYGQHFLDVLNLMAHPEIALIANIARGYRFANGDAGQSLVLPKPAFFEFVPEAIVSWNAFVNAEAPEVLILKGPKDRKTGRSEIIDYPETATTRRRRKEIQRINSSLLAAPIKIAADCKGIGFAEDGQPIDPNRRTVRRIFNNGDWTQGGRLFDGFWESMRRSDRFRIIRICTAMNPEGEHIANVDFGQLFPVLAYLRLNQSPPEGDLYDIAGDGSDREGWKKLINAMLFSIEPMRRWPRETSSLFSTGTKLADAQRRIIEFHAPIAGLFCTGVGFRLMLIESEILIAALGRLLQLGITALPLHDSVLVAQSEARRAKEVLAEAFSQFNEAAGRAKIKIDIG